MLGVETVGQCHVHVEHLDADDLEAAVLEPADDASGEPSLDRVGLQQDQGSLRHAVGLLVGVIRAP